MSILAISTAKYIAEYKIFCSFNNGISKTIDLEQTIQLEKRKIFEPLKEINYFKNFELKLNTIVWENEVDFAPEFLITL